MSTSTSAPEFPDVAPETIAFFAKANVIPHRRHPQWPHQIIWKRMSTGQGDETDYEFATRAAIHPDDDYFWVELLDSVFDAGEKLGMETVRRELRRVAGLEPRP